MYLCGTFSNSFALGVSLWKGGSLRLGICRPLFPWKDTLFTCRPICGDGCSWQWWIPYSRSADRYRLQFCTHFDHWVMGFLFYFWLHAPMPMKEMNVGWFRVTKGRVRSGIANLRVEVKWSRYRPGMAQRVGRGIAVLFHDRGTRRGWVDSSTPRPHFTPGKDPVPILQEAGWTPGPVWTGGKILSPPGFDPRPSSP